MKRLAAPIEERDAPVDVTTVIKTDFKTDVITKTKDVLDTIYRTDTIVRTDIVYQTRVANAPEVPRPTPPAPHWVEASQRLPTHVQPSQTHVQPVQPVQPAQTHSFQAASKSSSVIAHTFHAPAQTHVQPSVQTHPAPAKTLQSSAQTHAQAPAQTHASAPVQTHARAPAQSHAQAAPKTTKAATGNDTDGDIDTLTFN